MSLIHTVKQQLEAYFGLHIYRRGTPLGLDLKNDLRRLVPKFQPLVIADVGANIGQTSRYFNSLWPDADIYAFEPVSATYEKLTRRVAGRASKIRCVKLALSDEIGRADIYISNDSVQSSFDLNHVLPRSLSGEKETVLKTTLHDWCASENIKRIDLLKVDTEGHDLNVLVGATPLFEAQEIGAVLIEIHLGKNVVSSLQEIRSWLGRYDYVLCAIYNQEGYYYHNIFFGNFLFLPTWTGVR
jgi:FkbM family methyltransferase